MRLPCLSFVISLAACTSGGAATSNSTPTAPPAPRPGCQLANAGPVIGYTYRNTPQPPARAGRITDGIYDLVEMVRHTSSTGPSSSPGAPALRLSLKFTTLETSSNHASGRMDTAQEIPPRVECTHTRFATFENEIRVEEGTEGLDASPYTAEGDLLTVLQPHGDGGDPFTYVFRRRL